MQPPIRDKGPTQQSNNCPQDGGLLTFEDGRESRRPKLLRDVSGLLYQGIPNELRATQLPAIPTCQLFRYEWEFCDQWVDLRPRDVLRECVRRNGEWVVSR